MEQLHTELGMAQAQRQAEQEVERLKGQVLRAEQDAAKWCGPCVATSLCVACLCQFVWSLVLVVLWCLWCLCRQRKQAHAAAKGTYSSAICHQAVKRIHSCTRADAHMHASSGKA